MMSALHYFFFFFFNDTATTEIYTLSLHDALPIWRARASPSRIRCPPNSPPRRIGPTSPVLFIWRRSCARLICAFGVMRSEEHTSELQSLAYLVCRLLLEKKKKHSLDLQSTQCSSL